MLFSGKTALVTGAASGLGAAISRELSARGAVVYLADIDFQKAQQTAREIGGVPIHLDVSNALQVETVIREIVQKREALDIVINNAGIICPSEELLRFGPEEWRKILSVNLSGAIAGSLAAYSVMRHQGFGHIINIGSLSGLIPVPFFGPYAASKTALTGFTLGLAAEAEPHGVHVSLVCPGNLDTGMARSASLFPLVSPAHAAQRIAKGISRNEHIISLSALCPCDVVVGKNQSRVSSDVESRDRPPICETRSGTCLDADCRLSLNQKRQLFREFNSKKVGHGVSVDFSVVEGVQEP